MEKVKILIYGLLLVFFTSCAKEDLSEMDALVTTEQAEISITTETNSEQVEERGVMQIIDPTPPVIFTPINNPKNITEVLEEMIKSETDNP